MARPSHLFGSLSKTVSAGVHARGWWFLHATDVALFGGEPIWEDLSDSLREHAVADGLTLPAQVDVAWIRSAMPIGLQMEPFAAAAPRIGFVAVRIEERDAGRTEIAYPFVFAERGGKALLGFSGAGPATPVRLSIIQAFGSRVVFGAV